MSQVTDVTRSELVLDIKGYEQPKLIEATD